MQPHLNFLALIVAALIPMIMGFIYFHPGLMGSVWMKANGFIKENMTPPKPIMFLVAFVCSLLIAFFLWGWVTGAGGIETSQVKDPNDGHSFVTFQHGVFHGIAFSLLVLIPIFITMKIFEMRSWAWALVNVGYWSISVILMCGILSAWR